MSGFAIPVEFVKPGSPDRIIVAFVYDPESGSEEHPIAKVLEYEVTDDEDRAIGTDEIQLRIEDVMLDANAAGIAKTNYFEDEVRPSASITFDQTTAVRVERTVYPEVLAAIRNRD